MVVIPACRIKAATALPFKCRPQLCPGVCIEDTDIDPLVLLLHHETSGAASRDAVNIPGWVVRIGVRLKAVGSHLGKTGLVNRAQRTRRPVCDIDSVFGVMDGQVRGGTSHWHDPCDGFALRVYLDQIRHGRCRRRILTYCIGVF